MTISPTTTLSKPIPGEQVPAGTLAYFSARAKRQAYDLVMTELKASGISRSELALRLGMDLGQLSRTLGGPGNWTIDTASRLLFAICGKTLAYRTDSPLDKQAAPAEQPALRLRDRLRAETGVWAAAKAQWQTSSMAA